MDTRDVDDDGEAPAIVKVQAGKNPGCTLQKLIRTWMMVVSTATTVLTTWVMMMVVVGMSPSSGTRGKSPRRRRVPMRRWGVRVRRGARGSMVRGWGWVMVKVWWWSMMMMVMVTMSMHSPHVITMGAASRLRWTNKLHRWLTPSPTTLALNNHKLFRRRWHTTDHRSRGSTSLCITSLLFFFTWGWSRSIARHTLATARGFGRWY